MLRLVATTLVLVFVLTGARARADQNDDRLDRLFAELHEAARPEAGRVLEKAIWDIWIHHEDEAVATLMSSGIGAMNRGQERLALATFDRLVELAPDFAEAWNKRATIDYLIGAYEASLADIEATLELEPRHFGALSGRGLVYAAMGKLEAALESFEAALAVHPTLMGARINAEAIRHMLADQEI